MKNRNSLVFVVRFSKKRTANISIAVRRSTKRTAKIVGPFLFFHFRVWYLFLRAAEKYKSRIWSLPCAVL
jgi:hypothetical protein